ncbi:MAG: glycosyltransferase [Geminicoccaceae bacterium]|nr:glycosyltransferase [Geminicoccaceae bacterium]
MSIFWLLAALAFLVVGLWPFGPYQLTLELARRFGRFPPAPSTGGRAPSSFAICLCAYNEASGIRAKIEDLMGLREAFGGELDIHVYVDGADDGTADILREYGDSIDLVVSAERRGKTHGMNLLVARAEAEIILFTDATVMIDRGARAVLERQFADPAIGCVCSDLTYVNAGSSATASTGAAYWRFNEWSKGLETATGSVLGADGSLFAIRRRAHSPVPDGLIDDLHISLAILCDGWRVVRAPELRAFEPHTTDEGDEFRRKIRIACECMHVHFTLWPRLRRLDPWHLYKYVAHRLLRWLGGYALLASAICWFGLFVSLVGMIPALATVAIMLPVAVLAVRHRIAGADRAWNAVLAFAGASVGVWRAFRGERAVTWNVAASARRPQLAEPVP